MVSKAFALTAFRVVVFVLLAPFAWLLDLVDVWIGRYRFDRACNAAKGHTT